MKKRIATPQIMKMFKHKGEIKKISQEEYVKDWHTGIKDGSIKLDVLPVDVVTP